MEVRRTFSLEPLASFTSFDKHDIKETDNLSSRLVTFPKPKDKEDVETDVRTKEPLLTSTQSSFRRILKETNDSNVVKNSNILSKRLVGIDENVVKSADVKINRVLSLMVNNYEVKKFNVADLINEESKSKGFVKLDRGKSFLSVSSRGAVSVSLSIANQREEQAERNKKFGKHLSRNIKEKLDSYQNNLRFQRKGLSPKQKEVSNRKHSVVTRNANSTKPNETIEDICQQSNGSFRINLKSPTMFLSKTRSPPIYMLPNTSRNGARKTINHQMPNSARRFVHLKGLKPNDNKVNSEFQDVYDKFLGRIRERKLDSRITREKLRETLLGTIESKTFDREQNMHFKKIALREAIYDDSERKSIVAKSKLDLAAIRKTTYMLIKEKRTKVREKHKWFSTLLEKHISQDSELTIPDKQLLLGLRQVVDEDIDLSPQILYALLIECWKSGIRVQTPVMSRITTYLAMDVLKLSPRVFGDFLRENKISVPAKLTRSRRTSGVIIMSVGMRALAVAMKWKRLMLKRRVERGEILPSLKL